MTPTTPQSLTLPAPESAPAKVTLGFRCHPAEKLSLAQEALRQGFNLSEYVESLLALRHDQPPAVSNQQAEAATRSLRTALNHYEKDPILLGFLGEYVGKTLDYQDANGQTVKVLIRSVQNVFTVVINSFRKEEHHV